MNGNILAVNAGSSSIKFVVFGVEHGDIAQQRYRGLVEHSGAHGRFTVLDARGERVTDENLPGSHPDHEAMLRLALDWLDARADGILTAVHRVVHGGEKFSAPVLLDPTTLAELDALIPLAPLHQPHNLSAIRALSSLKPDLPQVACFDTAFHRGQPRVARIFALPRELTDSGIKRYGFHGLSYDYIASVLPQHLGENARGRVVVAHLGNGASLCALRDGVSVATTMGFTALDGLVMGTRCGSIDPGVLIYLMQDRGYSAADLADLLYRKSGLLGVSGVSSDMRALLASDDPRAGEAAGMFVYRVGRELGSLAAALQGLDALVFTAGIGEHSSEIRAHVCAQAAWLGIELDDQANRAHATRISLPGSRVSAWVIPTDEERAMARYALDVLNRARAGRTSMPESDR